MKRTLSIAILIALAALTVSAQETLPDYGAISDLNGMTKVYISAQTTKQRETIIKELKKSELVEVDSPDQAEFFLEYRVISDHQGLGALRFLTVEMSVYTTHGERRRIAWSKTTSPAARLGEVSLTRDFLKAIKGR